MRFEVKVAWRYLRSSRLQSGLILAGVALGIVVYTFMAALINGLADNLTQNVIGNLAHVTLEPRELEPRVLLPPEEGEALVAVQRSNERRARIQGWQPLVRTVEAMPGVTAVSPQVGGNGFIRRGEKIAPVAITGLRRGQISAIVDLQPNLVRGTLDLGPGDLVIGVGLADDLSVTTGQRLRLVSDRGRERVLTVRGIFDVGSASLNERVVFLELQTAQSLLDLPGAVSQIQLKLADIYAAPQIAERLAGATGLQAKNWIDENRRLQDALRSQGTTGDLIKVFSLMTIVVGVASVLLVAALRRRAEIGILRSMGVKRGSITAIFLLQGFLIGLIGSGTGAALGWGFCQLLVAVARRPDGSLALPVDPAQGEYLPAILLATAASCLAAILPARAASKVDPVEVIQQ